MKTVSILTTFAICTCIALLSLNADDSDPAGAADASERWSHLALPRDASEPLSDPDFARKINSLGAEGWELVNVLNFAKEGTTTRTVYYFKKPL